MKSIEAKAGRRPVAATTDKEAPADMLDCRHPPSAELKCVSARTEVEAVELMHLHNDLIHDDWKRSQVDSRVRSVLPGFRGTFAPPIDGSITRTNGCITRQELVRVPKVSGWRHVTAGSRDEKKRAAGRSRVAQSALAWMPSGVEAIDYMPWQLKSLPDHLKGPAVRILVFSLAGFGDRPFEITLEALRRGCSLVSGEEVSEIARHLGWKLS